MRITRIQGIFIFRQSIVTNPTYTIYIMGCEHVKSSWDKKKLILRRSLITSKDPQQYVKRK